MMVWKGRLRGATTFGLRGSSENASTAILEHEAIPAHGRPAAVLAIDAVNQRHHVAPAIRGRQIDRSAVRAREAHSVFDAVSGLILLQSVSAYCLEISRLTGTAENFRIRVVGEQIGVRQLLSLDHKVPVHRVRRTQGGQTEAKLRHADLEDVQHLQRREPLPGGGSSKTS